MSTIPAGYKQTEVGVIPEDWEAKPMGCMATFIGGNAFKSEAAVRGGVKWLKIANVGKRQILWEETSYLPIHYMDEYSHFLLHEGDVVMALTRPIIDNELKIARLGKADVPALLNQRVAKIIPSTSSELDFIYFVLQTRSFVDAMNEAMAGSDPPNIGSRALSVIHVATPPSHREQRAIAAALSDVDALLAKLDQLIAKKRDLKQATMQQLLTGQTRLPGFSGAWEVKRLGDVAQLVNGFAFKSSTYNECGRYKVVTIANVQDGFMSIEVCNKIARLPPDIQSHQCLIQGDILISMTGNVGRVCRVCDDDCLLNQRVGKLVPVGIDGGFLFCVLRQPGFLATMVTKAKGGAQGNLSRADITEYELNLPSSQEQTAIATVLSDMDAELAALEARRDKTRTLKQGMMQELLTGRMRLV